MMTAALPTSIPSMPETTEQQSKCWPTNRCTAICRLLAYLLSGIREVSCPIFLRSLVLHMLTELQNLHNQSFINKTITYDAAYHRVPCGSAECSLRTAFVNKTKTFIKRDKVIMCQQRNALCNLCRLDSLNISLEEHRAQTFPLMLPRNSERMKSHCLSLLLVA